MGVRKETKMFQIHIILEMFASYPGSVAEAQNKRCLTWGSDLALEMVMYK